MSILRNQLRENIFIRIMLAFILGIIGYHLLRDYISLGVLLCIVLLLTLLLLLFYYQLSFKYSITFKLYNGVLIVSICSIFAFCLAYFQNQSNHQSYVKALASEEFLVVVSNEGKKTPYNVSYEAILLSQSNYRGKILLKIYKDDSIRYTYGDTLHVIATLSSIVAPTHPAQFDYKNYLANKNIYHTLDARKEGITYKGSTHSFSIYRWSIRCRTRLLSILKSTIKDTESYEMAAALLLGERADLDAQLMKSYSDTGTIHIISVSGLHVGIIFIVIQFSLQYIPILKKLWIRTLLSIVFVWLYSILTGLPASVIRSATMISFHVVAKAINNKASAINHVGASSVILLSLNTNYLFDIGFQLSYLAVLGILYLQRWLSEWYYPPNKIIKLIYVTTTVSIAAQLFTLPFCLFYFHQFPNYFIPANLLAIPLSSIALYAAIASLFFSSITYLNEITEWVLTSSITILNKYLLYIASLPFATTSFDRFSVYELILLCLLIFFLLMYIKEVQYNFLKYMLMSMILLGMVNFRSKHWHNHVWIVQERNRVYVTLDRKKERIHFATKNINLKQLNRQLYLWRMYEHKVQRVVFIGRKYYRIQTEGIAIDNKHIIKHNGYKRICM